MLPPWRKSSRCSNEAGCVEGAPLEGRQVGVRDSVLAGESPVLSFSPEAWTEFTHQVRQGEFDLPR